VLGIIIAVLADIILELAALISFIPFLLFWVRQII